ncbi:hypothetical protein THAOC_04278, partial [Thalassiosira oceanica]
MHSQPRAIRAHGQRPKYVAADRGREPTRLSVATTTHRRRANPAGRTGTAGGIATENKVLRRDGVSGRAVSITPLTSAPLPNCSVSTPLAVSRSFSSPLGLLIVASPSPGGQRLSAAEGELFPVQNPTPRRPAAASPRSFRPRLRSAPRPVSGELRSKICQGAQLERASCSPNEAAPTTGPLRGSDSGGGGDVRRGRPADRRAAEPNGLPHDDPDGALAKTSKFREEKEVTRNRHLSGLPHTASAPHSALPWARKVGYPPPNLHRSIQLFSFKSRLGREIERSSQMMPRDNKRARLLPSAALDVLGNDLLVRCASYLDADGLAQLGRTSARLGIPLRVPARPDGFGSRLRLEQRT